MFDVILNATVPEETGVAYDTLFLNAEAVGDLLSRPAEDISIFFEKNGRSSILDMFQNNNHTRRLAVLAGNFFVAPSFGDYNKLFVNSRAFSEKLDPGDRGTPQRMSPSPSCAAGSLLVIVAAAAAGGLPHAAPGGAEGQAENCQNGCGRGVDKEDSDEEARNPAQRTSTRC